jgi:hypothetical protein
VVSANTNNKKMDTELHQLHRSWIHNLNNLEYKMLLLAAQLLVVHRSSIFDIILDRHFRRFHMNRIVFGMFVAFVVGGCDKC